MPAFAIDPDLYADLMRPTPPAPEPTREAQLEAALDGLLHTLLERILDRAELDELAANNPIAAARLLALLIRDLEWRAAQLQPKGAA